VRLREEGILAVVAAPGYCRTNFGGYAGFRSPEEGARPIVRAAVDGSPDELFGKIVDDENIYEEFGW
jgi:NAD(P)-dependent dehydrogenase (short-subunit alcohol dehydrogenase family)